MGTIGGVPLAVIREAIPFGTADEIRPEAMSAQGGQADMVPRADHRHPRLTATKNASLDADGNATVMFTRTFAAKPAIAVLAVDPTDAAVPTFKVKGWITAVVDGSTVYTGCTIYGGRTRAMPLLTGIVLLAPLVNALNGFLPYEKAANAEFLLIALQPSG